MPRARAPTPVSRANHTMACRSRRGLSRPPEAAPRSTWPPWRATQAMPWQNAAHNGSLPARSCHAQHPLVVQRQQGQQLLEIFRMSAGAVRLDLELLKPDSESLTSFLIWVGQVITGRKRCFDFLTRKMRRAPRTCYTPNEEESKIFRTVPPMLAYLARKLVIGRRIHS